jgi:hypothetical protein
MRWAVLLIVLVSGCEPLVDATYTGRPLFQLSGTLSAATRPYQVDARLALLWQDARTAGGPGVATVAIPCEFGALGAVSAEVPAQPPDAAWFAFDDGGPRLGEAYIHVVTHVPITTSDVDLGLDPMHALIYAEADVAGGAAADYLGGDVTAGYHLRRFSLTATPGAAQRQLIERCVASTGDRVSCEARRGYRLDPVDDATPLHIEARVR